MRNLEVIARLKIRPGHLERVKSQVAEILRATREKDEHTLRCDFFVNEDGTECEVHELFPDEQGLIEHKMHTMEATAVLLRDCVFDHDATIYGNVSQSFINLVTERMGSPTVFAFAHGLETQAPLDAPFEVIARLTARPGQREAFRTQVAELLGLTREKDTRTLRYDWFCNQDETEYEVHEAYDGEEGLIEHNDHIVDARNVLFRDSAFDHRMSVYGEISQHLSHLFDKHAGGVAKFSLLQGLEPVASV